MAAVVSCLPSWWTVQADDGVTGSAPGNVVAGHHSKFRSDVGLRGVRLEAVPSTGNEASCPCTGCSPPWPPTRSQRFIGDRSTPSMICYDRTHPGQK